MHPIMSTIIQRVLLGMLTLLLVSIVLFVCVQLMPGDFAQTILGQSATPEAVAALRHKLGLDQPAIFRFFSWIGGIIHGDFGYSFSGRNAAGLDPSRSVASLIAPRLANTLFLACMAAAIAVPLALVLGLATALKRDTWFDKLANAVTLVTISFPEFLMAYILILLLGVILPIFPTLSDVAASMTICDRAYKAALPTLTLTLVIVAHMMRMTRAVIIC